MVRGHSSSLPHTKNLFKLVLKIPQIVHHFLHRLLAVGTILSEESLLSPRPYLYCGSTNLCLNNNLDWVVVSSVRNHRGIREHTFYALSSSVILLLPTVSVASYISCMSRVEESLSRTLVGKGRREGRRGYIVRSKTNYNCRKALLAWWHMYRAAR